MCSGSLSEGSSASLERRTRARRVAPSSSSKALTQSSGLSSFFFLLDGIGETLLPSLSSNEVESQGLEATVSDGEKLV